MVNFFFYHVTSAWSEACCLKIAAWLAVKVLSGSKTLFVFRIVQWCAEESFGHLLSRLEGKAFAEKTVEVVKIIGEGPQQHEVQLDAPLQLCSNFCCKEIEYRLAFRAAAEKPRKNALDVLMASSKKVLLPKKYSGERLKADQVVVQCFRLASFMECGVGARFGSNRW